MSADKPAAGAPPGSGTAPAKDASARGDVIGAGSYGPVKQGETLLSIAHRARPEGVTLEQTLVGIYRANPDAFEPDHHRLKSAVVLKVPSREALAAIDQNAAVAEVRAASAKWRAEHPQAK
jgi:pilus assembly protein FimV